MIRVFLLDDHEVVRAGVRAALETEPDLIVVGEAATAAEALRRVEHCSPDVAVLDVRLEDGSGLDVCRRITARHPDVATLVLTSFDSDRAVVDAALAGAAGFVLKQIRTQELVESIRLVASGRRLLDPAQVRLATRRLADGETGRVAALSPQERRILDLIGDGLTNREIAERMQLADKTVKNYVSNLLAKLGVARRAEAAAMSARLTERGRDG